MAHSEFTGLSFLWRLLFAGLLVGATYNPAGLSYYHWVFADPSSFGPEKAVVGLVLLVGWGIYVRATARSLGVLGILVVVAFCGSLIWLLTSRGWLAPYGSQGWAYISLGVV